MNRFWKYVTIQVLLFFAEIVKNSEMIDKLKKEKEENNVPDSVRDRAK